MYLIDTNIISELRKGKRCDAHVSAWYASIADEELFLSTLVLGEIRKGVELARPRDPDKAAALERWLHRVRVPTLVLWGRDDKLFPSAYAKAWAERLPDSRVDIIPECGHRPHVEKADVAAEKILGFIGGRK